jgi:hypothetical protein
MDKSHVEEIRLCYHIRYNVLLRLCVRYGGNTCGVCVCVCSMALFVSARSIRNYKLVKNTCVCFGTDYIFLPVFLYRSTVNLLW